MTPWRCLDRAPLPGGGELSLHQRGDELVIRVDGRELMSSRQHHSEEELGRITGQALEVPAPRICVAGLGMGFTLAAVLREVGSKARVDVIEHSPAVVRWNRGPLAPLADRPLADPRCTVVETDVVSHLSKAGPDYDALLLDVDNGPEALSSTTNAWLYESRGLGAIHDRLRPGGVLSLWSAGPDEAFTRRLRAAGFAVSVRPLRSQRAGRGRRHQLWIGRRSRATAA